MTPLYLVCLFAIPSVHEQTNILLPSNAHLNGRTPYTFPKRSVRCTPSKPDLVFSSVGAHLIVANINHEVKRSIGATSDHLAIQDRSYGADTFYSLRLVKTTKYLALIICFRVSFFFRLGKRNRKHGNKKVRTGKEVFGCQLPFLYKRQLATYNSF